MCPHCRVAVLSKGAIEAGADVLVQAQPQVHVLGGGGARHHNHAQPGRQRVMGQEEGHCNKHDDGITSQVWNVRMDWSGHGTSKVHWHGA